MEEECCFCVLFLHSSDENLPEQLKQVDICFGQRGQHISVGKVRETRKFTVWPLGNRRDKKFGKS